MPKTDEPSLLHDNTQKFNENTH